MENFEKIICIGNAGYGRIYCRISYNSGNLSITGVEGPRSSGHARGDVGQIVMSLPGQMNQIKYAKWWDAETLLQFIEIWNKWHLNDMKAGTPAQEAELERRKSEYTKGTYYDWAKNVLKEAGLEPDNGYEYGSAWLKVDVPEDVLLWLKSLPDSDTKPAWI